MSYQNDYMGVYSRFDESEEKAEDLNYFLNTWLVQISAKHYTVTQLE